ncbi:hypothetical protein MSAS_45300 [Mycobacterium saskatchewanense]|uniref:Uncharacterized protein n=1 Tax=Mycobacterium saskatchewanense TaxID=220927 RepID=A0AAJ3NU31_9MYCO|nr:hypothetical protein [Mycobacterium saskatchewanense]ORW74653.1 hypothetical protein AWC23_04535 [Mycobacterium saskatchewanense]BBX65356.1 hypothetical protein MSAS_45300 [Mycobacterium saskatchewanense]
MPAESSAGRTQLKVLAAGLHKLGLMCGKVSAELGSEVTLPSVTTSEWASSAATVGRAAAASAADASSMGHRIGARGADYAKAATVYVDTEEGNAARFRGLTR